MHSLPLSRSYLLSVTLLLSFLPLLTAVISNRVTNNLLVLYTFQEGQWNVSTPATLDQSRTNLLPAVNLPTLSSSWSATRQGLTFTGQFDNSTTPTPSLIQSSAIVSYFKVSLSTSFTIEAFLTPASLTQQGVIAGFGSWDASTIDSGCQGGSTGWRDWYWYQNGNTLTTVLSHAGSTPGCSSVSMPLNVSAAVHHVVTSVALIGGSSGMANVTCYYNGQFVLSTLITQTSFQQWQVSNYLQFSSARLTSPASPSRTWQGSLYLFAMYSPALSTSQVATNYQSYLPNSAPVLAYFSQSVTVLQNSTVAPLTTVSFNATDYDNDNILYRITTLPIKGTLALYDPLSNTTTTLSVGTVFYLSSASEVFCYTPVSGEWNTSYVVFSFAACDMSVCGVSALVTVNVQHIVTPPLPVSQSLSLLSGSSIVVQLSGLDVDMQAPLRSNMSYATLLSLPTNGLLYGWNGSAAVPARPLTASSLLTLNASASPLCPLCLLYAPTMPLSATNGSNYNDTITFAVAVKNTSSLVNASVTITVTNPLMAQPITVSLLGDSPLYFSLRGTSALNTRFSYLALSLPQKGNFTLQNGQAVSIYSAGGSATVNGAVTLWSTSQVVFTSSVSVYAGRYNSALDPISDTFSYSLLDSTGNRAASTLVTILYPPIHHAQSVLSAFTAGLVINATTPSQDSSTWTVVPYTITVASR